MKITIKKPAIFFLPFMLGISACVQVPKTVQFNNSLSYTKIGDYRFHTQSFGNSDATPIIIVHGGPGGDHAYLRSLQGLSNKYRVIFYDQRGNGLSPRVDKSQLTLASNLADLNAIIENFSPEGQVKLIGHSWGGMLVTAYLSNHPDRVSQAVIVEPGMLDPESAKAFVEKIKESHSMSDMFALAKYIMTYPFVRQVDGHEGFDYVMTNVLNRNKPGAPYQCDGEAMPAGIFKRGGYEAFSNMLKPVMDDPNSFTHELTEGITKYSGDIMLISSECSLFGYDFQAKYHLSKLPPQTIHVKAENMGHNMLTLNTEWSLKTINEFFQ